MSIGFFLAIARDFESRKIIIQNAPPISKIEVLSFYLLNYISDAR
jgi:hypothetical protein